MAIDVLHSSTIKAMPENVASTRNVKRSASNTQAAAASTSASSTTARKYSADEVAFTDRAKLFSEAKGLADASDGIDYEKVAALKAQIESDTYEINYSRTAEKMIAFESALGFL